MLLANILLALAWTALQGQLSNVNLLVGYGLGYLVLRVLARGGVLPSRYLGKVGAFLGLLAYLGYELVLANITLAIDVVTPNSSMRPAIVRLPLDVTSDAEILMFAALINLTPGSLALDVSADRKTMYVHIMHIDTPDKAREEMKTGFERRVRRLFE